VASEGVRVVIGSENEEEAMRECSMVVTRYGIPGEFSGALGVVGPTRLEYRVAIPAVGFLSGVMTELVGEVYG
jgi:heat-inducible transcriptional repressor